MHFVYIFKTGLFYIRWFCWRRSLPDRQTDRQTDILLTERKSIQTYLS